MSEKRSRGQPKFEPTQDQRSQVKLMKALGIPEDRICKAITNPRTQKPVLGDAIKSEQVRMTAAIFYAKTKMGWKETVVNEQVNKDDKPFLVDDARQRLIDEVDRIRARKEQKGE